MLKLLKNYVPTWDIDGINKDFKTDKLIGAIQSIIVDWVDIWEAYTWDKNITITLDVAPVTSITFNFFYRDVNAIRWNWMVTLWDLRDDFYRKIWRLNENGTIPTNLNRLYPEAYVKSELRKSLKRITNKSPEVNRLQQYSTVHTSGSLVIWTTSDNTVTLEQTMTEDIEGVFYVWDWVAYDYYSVNGNVFQVKGSDISQVWDRLLIWSKIPFWVQKVSEVRIEWTICEYIDERDFHMWNKFKYTIIKDWQGNSYLFFPYSEEQQVIAVQYVPDMNHFVEDADIINIEEEYTDVVVYDTVYRLLRDKEDERWIWFKEELWDWKRQWLLYEYQAFVKSQIKKTRAKIWFASTF